MITLENTKVYNIARAVYSARNPLNSWAKSDSDLENDILGPNDLDLAQRLIRAGSDHRKFMRQIFVSVDITAPLYWWKEADTYKVGTVGNSTSTMHKIHSKPFDVDDFSHDHMTPETEAQLQIVTDYLEILRQKFNETKDKRYWYDMIQFLPSSYNQMRTITMSYENLRNMYFARRNHKLDEWHTYCDWIKTLPYGEELICFEGKKPEHDGSVN